MRWLGLGLLGLLAACASPQRVDPSAAGTPPAAVSAAAAPITRAAAAAYDSSLDIFHPVAARHGMVVSEQAEAARAGLDMLRAGGNAVDAAVAVGFALAVTLPNAGNLGGGGFMMVHEARGGRDHALDFRETAPARAGRDMYLDARGEVVDGRSLYTHQAVGVPGTVAGLTHALARWGTLPLSRVMAPAIRLAERGYPVSPTLADTLSRNAGPMGRWPATRAVFWR
ncbi:gamma-glutamyltransferase, partial [Castellaniella sp.]|uniref:gamma-glutamyltransferase n=1 Tax=Castellaniella sp. TaxID=1955812 RepID=UPI002AFEE5C3